MLVLSRKIGESVVIDDLIVTVDSFVEDHSILSLMRTNCEFLGKITLPFRESVEISDTIRAVMIRSERDKLRLGFDLPKDSRVARWEAWDPDQKP